ncbi:hypothetical protein [Mycolicibacterium brumae]|uniref:Peptidase inhibitor family I36 n=1 Tax=Mycolicibacterium brumae TaxID=85968 RepID=A0A2G5PGG7_9MYCO|nr:hypothetical protein [Mycolicibacterium brumae]MCV7192609.1 hypothetical protein [Mycolicibacterium brumae]PIB77407.1 hypothetical protein CQY22_000020 [Mycolicibacterium brumae]RWA18399.1 hypothetical protein MBRU_04075 [Mycolicibacterium brumae DSM 44177]UWW10379.1 hypothetical protein L2Z93_003508 [Mycolicibacterium brumae]
MKATVLSAIPPLLLAVGTGVALAPPAAADCVSSGGTTICSQGDVRGADGSGPGVYSPYPCEYDWYCYDGFDIVWDIDGGGGNVSAPPRVDNDLPRRGNNRPGRR